MNYKISLIAPRVCPALLSHQRRPRFPRLHNTSPCILSGMSPQPPAGEVNIIWQRRHRMTESDGDRVRHQFRPKWHSGSGDALTRPSYMYNSKPYRQRRQCRRPRKTPTRVARVSLSAERNALTNVDRGHYHPGRNCERD